MNGLILTLQEWLDLYDAAIIAADEMPLAHVEQRYRSIADKIDEYIQNEFDND